MENRNVVKVLNDRKIGIHHGKGASIWEKIVAEKILLRRIYSGIRSVKECVIPTSRAKFLIVFSPDGTKLASTNGNHNVYIIDVATKKILKTLQGHKRTPWTVAFHPSNNGILASGCLSGEVRVWNLDDDSCEVWQSPGQTVIASLSFHPKVKLLVIATYKDIYFWDWNSSLMYGRTSTENEEEKIRYVKFDSTGDKLITAIALNGSLLSQYDSISLREVYHLTRERNLLRDIRIIEKYCESHVSQQCSKYVENLTKTTELFNNTSTMKSPSIDYGLKIDITENTMPYMCIHHHSAIHAFLNVGCFCPTLFSHQIVTLLKNNTLPTEYFAEKCYFCRYVWLYRVVFEFQLTNASKSHICKEFRFMMSDKHVWKFADSRKDELRRENERNDCGFTEETIRYRFEEFARARIAPYFSKHMANGVCSKCIIVDETNDNEHGRADASIKNTKKPFSHNVSMRSDCFLNVCEMYKFTPSGSFVPFMVRFAELYQYLPALQQISTKEDSDTLNMLMTEWEYLYCKLLLVNNLIEGDDGLMMKKWTRKTESSNESPYVDGKKTNDTPSDWSLSMEEDTKRKRKRYETNGVRETSHEPSRSSLINVKQWLLEKNCIKPHEECHICKPFDEDHLQSNRMAVEILRVELKKLRLEIIRRNDPKTQRTRMEKLYRQQLEYEIKRVDGALFRTIQVTKKCIRAYISSVLTELKKLLKTNFTSLNGNECSFSKVVPRLFLFLVRKTISFTGNLLKLLFNFKYDISELTEINSIKIASSPPLFSIINLPHRRDYTFEVNWNNEPVLDEELESLSSESSDDEISSSISDHIFSGKDERPLINNIVNQSRASSSNSSPTDVPAQSPTTSRRIIVSASYLNKHLKFLEYISEEFPPEPSVPDGYQMLLLQNVNSLFNHFQYHSAEETTEHRSNHHPLHRLQMWDFSDLQIPDISSKIKNIVVTECKVHNDATIAISNDDKRVAVLLSANQFDQPDWLGIFSLEWKTIGQIQCTVSLNQIAVSLSFSPTDRYLVVGYSFTYNQNLKMADIIAVQRETERWKNTTATVRHERDSNAVATSLIDITNSSRTDVLTTVNCIKWIPTPGEGLVFGNSAGEIKFVA